MVTVELLRTKAHERTDITSTHFAIKDGRAIIQDPFTLVRGSGPALSGSPSELERVSSSHTRMNGDPRQ